ncbi:diguanylate cyclase [uncultured Holdemanella sp.]|uniref:GGDEF domain-containing protein n=1 Tax=uncultured Holdemanella sp. TaxID=1763549 RepID=UPI0034222F80
MLDSKTSATLCYCDLDHLKYVNANYGHDKGDAYICHFVEILQSNIREALVLELSILMEMKRLLYLTSCKRLIKECMHKNEKSKMTTIQVVTFLTSYICL